MPGAGAWACSTGKGQLKVSERAAGIACARWSSHHQAPVPVSAKTANIQLNLRRVSTARFASAKKDAMV
jgi:ribose 5-phosphate isomerase RpiB